MELIGLIGILELLTDGSPSDFDELETGQWATAVAWAQEMAPYQD